MKYEVNTVIHARVMVEADGENEAYAKAEEYASSAIQVGDGDNRIVKSFAAARDADEIA